MKKNTKVTRRDFFSLAGAAGASVGAGLILGKTPEALARASSDKLPPNWPTRMDTLSTAPL
ncbi:twin-arginine translocation signal domain-containing protein [bacterium]|nr:twin-arginine translocation signal domain-containing protein [bacterium]